MFDQARALDSAMRSSESYFVPQPVTTAATASEIVHQNQVDSQVDSTHSDSTLAAADPKCFFCGNSKHTRSKCPAKDAICNKCQKRGHFVKVCRGKASKPDKASVALWLPTLATVGTPPALKRSTLTVVVNKDRSVEALFVVVAAKAIYIQLSSQPGRHGNIFIKHEDRGLLLCNY